MNALAKLSLADQETLKCPFGYYEAMRNEDPVHFDEQAGCYIVSRYEDVMQVLSQPLVYSSALGFEMQRRGENADEIDALFESHGIPPMKSAVTSDPPYHTRIRALMDKAFTAHRVATMESYITGTATELLGPLSTKGSMEFVSEFAIPFPIYIIADQLGVPRSRFKDFRRWSDATVEPLGRMLSKERALWCAHQTIEMWDYILEAVAERRANPTDDMISDLAHASIDDPENPMLTPMELFQVVSAFIVAGNETTTTAIGNAMLRLVQEPELAERLASNLDDDRSFTRFSEEILRLETPVQVVPRVMLEEAELGGTIIPKDAMVLVCYASANRDTAKFECPEKFDAARKNVGQHLAFGGGIHRCIGAMLARMEIKVAAREILRHLKDVCLDMPESEITYAPSMVVRALMKLPVRYNAR